MSGSHQGWKQLWPGDLLALTEKYVALTGEIEDVRRAMLAALTNGAGGRLFFWVLGVCVLFELAQPDGPTLLSGC